VDFVPTGNRAPSRCIDRPRASTVIAKREEKITVGRRLHVSQMKVAAKPLMRLTNASLLSK
jgi:hypothetical protein